jgi:transposase
MEQDVLQGRRPFLPPDVENCHRVIWEYFETMLASQAHAERVEAEKAELIRRFFGPRRERFADDPAQGKLFETEGPPESDAAEPTPARVAEEEPPAAPRKKHRHGRRRFPANFPRVRREHQLSDAERRCPCCGKLRKIIGEEVSEQLDYVPGHHRVIEHVRFKYACEDCQEHVAIAAKPPQAIEKGAAASGLLAHIATSKFGDHLPTYRQEEISDRHGWLIPRTTQCGWLRQMSGTLAILVALLAARVLRSRKIHTDDTRVPVILPGQPKTKTAYFWVYCGDEEHRYSVYDFTLSHCRDGPAWWLRRYRGYLQADAYGGYDGIAIESEGRLPGCQRLSQYLDILRCHTRSLADAFLDNELPNDIVSALSELLPDRWVAAHPEHRLEINRPTGTPVGLEAALRAVEP